MTIVESSSGMLAGATIGASIDSSGASGPASTRRRRQRLSDRAVEPADAQREQQPQQQLPDQRERPRGIGVVAQRRRTCRCDVVARGRAEGRPGRDGLSADVQLPALVDAGCDGDSAGLGVEVNIGIVTSADRDRCGSRAEFEAGQRIEAGLSGVVGSGLDRRTRGSESTPCSRRRGS